mgnify:CR=1 FL=1
MKIMFLHAWGINTLTPQPKGLDRNFIGDETVSIAFCKYLKRKYADFIELSGRYWDRTVDRDDFDICVDMNYTLADREKAKKQLWYCQNGYREGSERIFEEKSQYYDGIIIGAKKLYEIYKDWTSRSGHKPIYMPVATDVELWYPEPDPQFNFDIMYCGNDTKLERTLPMINPCLKYNFGLFGRWSEECKKYLYDISLGQVSMDDLRKVYSSTKYMLNIHMADMANYGLYTGRMFDVLACNGIVISDNSYGLSEEFGERILIVNNENELIGLLHKLLSGEIIDDPKILNIISKPKSELSNRQWLIQNKYTWEDKTNQLVEYLKEFE